MKLPRFNGDRKGSQTGDKQPRQRGHALRTRAFRAGGYSVAAALIVIAMAVAVNVLAGALPDRLTQVDTTSSQLYSLSQETENLLAGLEQDVTIHWIVQAGQEDSRVELLLDQYAGHSDHVRVERVDPDVRPTFLQQYELTSVYNNSFVVECGETYRYVSYSDVYEYSYTTYETSFAGEGALTSAISYVTSEDLPKVYTLTGHGESDLSSTFADAVEQQNFETEELSLLTVEQVPEDADGLLIYNPQSDLSQEEIAVLEDYLDRGGSLMLLTSPLTDGGTLPNLEGLMEERYGVSAAQGIVMEGDQSRVLAGYTPAFLLPQISSHDITSPLVEGGYYVLLYTVQGLTVSDDLPDGVSVTQMLTTTDQAYSKTAGYDMTTYEKEEGDIDGPFALAVAVTDQVDEDVQSHVVWVSSATLLDDAASMVVSGANQDLFLNSLSWMTQQEQSISIHAKSLGYDYLTIPSSTASLLTVVMVGLIPLACLGVGITIWIRRKRR